jgi:transposase
LWGVPNAGGEIAEPQDLAAARLIIASLQQDRRLLSEQLQKAQRENALLQHKLDVLCRRLFGRKSDKVDPNQLRLALELLGSAPASDAIEADSGEEPRTSRSASRQRPKGRQQIPAELPRDVVVQDIPESERRCACCGEEKRVIGEEVSEKFDYSPASLYVIQTRRIKRACPKGHGVSVAPAPPQALEKSLAAEGLLAHVVVSKFADHLPLHRQEGIFSRHGAHLPRSTLCGWVAAVGAATAPIVEHMKQELIATDYLQTDDTPVLVLKKLAGSFKGRLWTYLDPLGRQVVYDATPTHEQSWPEAFLEGFGGHLQADAYVGYDKLYQRRVTENHRRIIEVGCWAHARRRFRDALETDPRAAAMLDLIRELYHVEKDAAGLPHEQRKALRQERSLSVLAQIDELRKKLEAEVLPKSPLGEAVRYLSNQWRALNRFVEDGRLRPDNNGAESQLRVVALGRKNWMFAGSLAGARWAATIFSLVQSCRLVHVDPFLYFRDVLRRLPTHPQRLIGQLTPRGWAETFAKTVAA